MKIRTILDLRNVYFERIGYTNYNFLSRKREDVFARNAFMCACSKAFTLSAAGEAFEKDHSTVVHVNKSHTGNLRFSPLYRDYYQEALNIVREYSGDVTDNEDIQPAHFLRVEIASLKQEIVSTKKEVSRLKKLVSKLTKEYDRANIC